MKIKSIIIPILFLIIVAVLIDRIFVANPSLMNGANGANNENGNWFTHLVGGSNSNDADDADNDSDNPNHVTYFCREGQVVADFVMASSSAAAAGGTVTITLPDGRNLTLAQVASGSGIRYAKDDMEFSGKGDNAFIMEKGRTIYSDCVAGSVRSDSASATSPQPKYTFTNQDETFSFTYPKTFTVVGGETGLTQIWRQNTETMGTLLATVVIPRSFQPKTNLSEATFMVGTSADPAAVSSCLKPVNGEVLDSNVGGTDSSGRIRMNGITFTKIKLGDAAAGSFYDTTSYRTIRDNQCYAIEYTIHSTTLGNYDPSQGISQFDMAKVQNVLEDMVKSFRFLR
jgi:membrane-bound inhibitor of C-type lysozyme